MYNGLDEASRIPPEWHAWLHYTVDAIPDPNKLTVKPWQQDHLPTLLGRMPYRPRDAAKAGGVRQRPVTINHGRRIARNGLLTLDRNILVGSFVVIVGALFLIYLPRGGIADVAGGYQLNAIYQRQMVSPSALMCC